MLALITLFTVVGLLSQTQGRSFYIIGDSTAAHWQAADAFKDDVKSMNTLLAGWGTFVPLFTKWGVKNVARGYMSTRTFLQFFDTNPQTPKAECPFPLPPSSKESHHAITTNVFKLEADDVVVLVLGINDICNSFDPLKPTICSRCTGQNCPPDQPALAKGESGPVATYEENVHTIIRKLRAIHPNIPILITSHTPMLDGTAKVHYSPFYDKMKKLVQEAKDPNIKFVDLTSIALQFIGKFVHRLKFMDIYHSLPTMNGRPTRDLHPNTYGARLYASLFMCALVKADVKGDYLNDAGKQLDCYNVYKNMNHPLLKIPYKFRIDENTVIRVPKLSV